MSPPRWASTIVAILGLGCALGTALPDVPSPENFLRRVLAQGTVLGNYVYIDGGELNQLVDGKLRSNVSERVNSTLSIDISKPWNSKDVKIRSIPKPGPAKAGVVLWTDQEAGVFYSWGGRFPGGRDVKDPELWKFTADGEGGGTWSVEDPANPTRFGDLHPTEDGAYANTPSQGFVIGGVADAYTEPGFRGAIPIPGMVSFDMKTKLWQNGTTNFSPFGTTTLIQASAEYIPTFGPEGLIMVLGGYAPTNVNEAWGPAFDLGNLTFFNPETKKSYWQTATGNIPPTPRGQACSTVFHTPDGGSDIFFFGGTNGPSGTNYRDAYILSLPGFVWTRLPDPPGGARAGASCVPVGKREVLSIGGADKSRTDRDPAPQGLILFDMTSLEWKDTYDASTAEYERANSLKDWYSSGSLEKVDWSSDEVKTLFATVANPPAPSEPEGTKGEESGSAPVGAIVGGVVGGIGGAALIGVLAWMMVHRKRKTAVPTSDPDSEAGGNGARYSAYPNDSKGAGVPETPGGNGRYSELPATDAAATYPSSGPVEAGPKSARPPAEMDSSYYGQPAKADPKSARPPAEMDSSYYGQPAEMGLAGAVEMDATPVRQ